MQIKAQSVVVCVFDFKKLCFSLMAWVLLDLYLFPEGRGPNSLCPGCVGGVCREDSPQSPPGPSPSCFAVHLPYLTVALDKAPERFIRS